MALAARAEGNEGPAVVMARVFRIQDVIFCEKMWQDERSALAIRVEGNEGPAVVMRGFRFSVGSMGNTGLILVAQAIALYDSLGN